MCVVCMRCFSVTMQLSSYRTIKSILKDYSTKIVGETILSLKFICCVDTAYNET